MKKVFCFIVHSCLTDQSAQPSTGLVPLGLEPMCAFINGPQPEPYHCLWILGPDPSTQKDVVHAADWGNLQFPKDAFGGATNCDLKVHRRGSLTKSDLRALCNYFCLKIISCIMKLPYVFGYK